MVRSTVSHWSLASTGAIWFPEVHQYAFCGISGLDYLMYTMDTKTNHLALLHMQITNQTNIYLPQSVHCMEDSMYKI